MCVWDRRKKKESEDRLRDIVAADLRRTHELTSKHLSAAIMNVDDYESLPTNSVAVHMTAGAVAGIMEHCVMYPFDSVKVSSAHTLSSSEFFT